MVVSMNASQLLKRQYLIANKVVTYTADRKVNPLQNVRWAKMVDGVGKGAKSNMNILNSFGLQSQDSCPGATDACKAVCYVDRMKYDAVVDLLDRNTEIMRSCGDDVEEMVNVLRPGIAKFVRQSEKYGVKKVFRIHWSGDFYSRAYAQAWAQICRENPDTRFWAYTRSFVGPVNVVDILDGVENLAVYLSVDVDNWQAAKPVLEAYPNVQPSIMAEDVQEIADKLIGRKVPICPVDKPVEKRKIFLANVVDENGRVVRMALPGDDNAVGGCVACDLCIDGKKPIGFPTRTASSTAKVSRRMNEYTKKLTAEVAVAIS